MSNEFNIKNGFRIGWGNPITGITNTQLINNDGNLPTEGLVYRELSGKTDTTLFNSYTAETSSIYVNVTGDTMSGNLVVPELSATSVSATTYYGDGSNLSGISTDNFFTTGTTLYGNTLYFNRNDILSAYTTDLSYYDYSIPIDLLSENLVNLGIDLNTHTGDTNNPHQTTLSNLTSSAHTHQIDEVINLQSNLNNKADLSGSTFTGPINGTSISGDTLLGNEISATTISATTYYGDGSNLTGISVPTSLTNTIFVDATRGDNATADGSIAKPYKTPEQAVADFDPVVLSFVGDITSGTNYISVAAGITVNLKEGQLIIGTGIPFDTRVVALAQYGITISNNATATAVGQSLEAWREATIEAYGDFRIVSSIAKDGIIGVSVHGIVSVGDNALFLCSTYRNTHLKFKADRWLGTHANSKMLWNTTSHKYDFIFEYDVPIIKSIGTGYVIDSHNLGMILIAKHRELETLGYYARGIFYNSKIDANKTVCTLGGIAVTNDNSRICGHLEITTATSINCLSISGGRFNFTGYLSGSTSFSRSTGILNLSSLYGATHDLGFAGIINAATSGASTINFNANAYGGKIIANLFVNNNAYGYQHIRNKGVNLTLNVVDMKYYLAGTFSFTNESGNAICTFNNCALRLSSLSGEVEFHGKVFFVTDQMSNNTIQNSVIKNYAEITSPFDGYYRVITLDNSRYVNYGTIRGTKPYRFDRLFLMKNGSVFENRNGHISVANGMPPFLCEGAAQDIRWFNGTTNCDIINSIEKGYGKVIYVRITTTETDTQFDLFDGTNTETFSVVGAGLTREQIAQQFVTDILASTLVFEYVEIGGATQGLTDYDIQIVGLEEQPILASALTNATTSVRVDFGYKPNFLNKINLVEDPTLD